MDTTELGDILLGVSPKKRDQWFEILKHPEFKPIYNYPSWNETREHPLRKLQVISKAKVVSVKDFITDPHNIFTAHEFLGMTDGALGVKFTV